MSVSGFVCYCPDLRLYRYKVSDDSKPENEREVDYKFDDDELENVIATHLAQDNEEQADFMAKLTGLARISPHKLVYFDLSKEKVELVEPETFWKEHDARREEELKVAQASSKDES